MAQQATQNDAPTPLAWRDVSRRWPDLVMDIRRAWPELAYMEVLRISGDRGRLCRLLSERYGVSLDEADELVWRWQAGMPLPETT